MITINAEHNVISDEVPRLTYRAFQAILNAAEELYEAATSEMDTDDDMWRLEIAALNFEELLQPVVEQEFPRSVNHITSHLTP